MATFPHLEPFFIDGFDMEDVNFARIGMKYNSNISLHQSQTTPGYDGVGKAFTEFNGGTFITRLEKDLPNTNDCYLFNINFKVISTFFTGCEEIFFQIGDGFSGTGNTFPMAAMPLAIVLMAPTTASAPKIRLWKNITNANISPRATPTGDYTELYVSPDLVAEQWYKLQLKFIYSTGYVEFWFSEQGDPGSMVYSGSSSFTKSFSKMSFYGGGDTFEAGWTVDDFVVWVSDDGTGNFPGDEIIVKSQAMNAAGVNNWTRNTNTYGANNWGVINEGGPNTSGRLISDLLNSYNVSGAANEESYFFDAGLIPFVQAIGINVAWSSSSGTKSITPVVGSVPVGSAKSLTSGSPTYVNDNGWGMNGWKVDQWITETPAADNWGVIADSAGVQMTQYYLEAITGTSSSTNQIYSAQFAISGNTVTTKTYTAQFSIADITPVPPPVPQAPSVTCNPNGPLNLGANPIPGPEIPV